jgi:serine/threonine-protein kinase
VAKARRLKPLRARQTLGKYRIEGRLAAGGYADVFRAYDTIEGIRVALKIPFGMHVDDESVELFRREARMTARLDHPNILPIKNAEFIEGRFVIASLLGEGTLGDRMTGRLSAETALDFTAQMLDALAYAHEQRIVHCDVKPENFIVFPDDRLRLTDFGIAKVVQRNLQAAGTGTVGYLAPEQAMGRPSLRSDVFSLGVVIWQMFAGRRPEWPYEWPPPGADRARKKLHPEMVALLRKALEVPEPRRFPDAVRMLAAFERIQAKAIHPARRRRRRRTPTRSAPNWKTLRVREFKRRFGKLLETRHDCARCGGPVSEAMTACPWCAAPRKVHRDGTRFPAHCPRCRRGVKLDWKFCPWCFGPGIGPLSDREFSDVRYEARCSNPGCSRKELMPFMRYCPWCRRKVKRRWKIEGTGERCGRCGWGALHEYWEACPWCGRRAAKR